MPSPPHYIDSVNAVVDLIENPCDAPWTVYFETALPAAGEALIALLSFGMDDIIRAYLRPKNLRTRPHLRRNRKNGRRRPGIPELGEMIGKRLPGAALLSGRHVSQGVKNLWIIDGVIQRLLWYWLVVDVTSDFFYTWNSLILKSEYCKKATTPAALVTGTGSPPFPNLDWTGINVGEVRYARAGATASVASVGCTGGTGMVVGSLSVVPSFGNPTGFQTRIRMIDSRGSWIEQSPVVVPDADGSMHSVVSIPYLGQCSAVLEAKIIGGSVQATGASLALLGR